MTMSDTVCYGCSKTSVRIKLSISFTPAELERIL